MAGVIKPNTYPTATTSITISLNSLASTVADPPVGRESTEVIQSTDLAGDVFVSGQIKAGTTPTAGKIQIFAVAIAQLTAGPTYRRPAGVTGADAGLTPGVWWKDVLFPLIVINTDTTTGKVYDFTGASLLKAFGGLFIPTRWSLFVFHSMVAALDSSAGGVLEYTPEFTQYT